MKINNERVENFKLYGKKNNKIKTFKTEESLIQFVNEKNISWSDVIVLVITHSGFIIDENKYKVYLRDVYENEIEYNFVANLYINIFANGKYTVSWDAFRGENAGLEKTNLAIKDIISKIGEDR